MHTPWQAPLGRRGAAMQCNALSFRFSATVCMSIDSAVDTCIYLASITFLQAPLGRGRAAVHCARLSRLPVHRRQHRHLCLGGHRFPVDHLTQNIEYISSGDCLFTVVDTGVFAAAALYKFTSIDLEPFSLSMVVDLFIAVCSLWFSYLFCSCSGGNRHLRPAAGVLRNSLGVVAKFLLLASFQ